ncbi:MAG: AsmA family protein [Acidiferrobacter sp.]
MTKLSRIAAVAAALLVLVVIGIVALPGLLALNNVKNEVAQTLGRATGRAVTIGQLHLALFPWLGIRIDGATIGNAPGFGRRPLAHVDEALIEVRLLPLFARTIVLRRVVLTGLTLRLEKNAQGRSNWSTLTTIVHPRHPVSAAEAHEAPAFALLRAAGITLRDARVRYRDARTHARYTVSDLSLTAGTIVPGRPVRFAVRGVAKVGGHSLPFAAHGSVADNGGTTVFSPLTMQLANVRAHGEVHATTTTSGLHVTGALTVPVVTPRPLLAALGVVVNPRDPRALTHVSGHFAFQYALSRLRLRPLVVTLDHTTARGRIDADLRTQRDRVDLIINHLDVDHYLPAAMAPAAPSPAVSSPPPPTAPPPPTTALRLHGHLQVGTLVVHGLTLTAVNAGMGVAAGTLRLAPVSAHLYGGTATAALTAQTAVPSPIVRVQGQLTGVHVGALLGALHLFREFSGILTAQAHLHGRGTTMAALEKTLSGTARMDIRHGTLWGLNLDIIGKDPRAATGTHRAQRRAGTAFGSLRASAVIVHGVVQTHNLVIHTARAVIHGAGTVSLAKKSLNYLLTVALPSGIAVPVRVQGPFGHIHFNVALGHLFVLPNMGAKSGAQALGDRLKQLLGLH